MGAGQQKYEYEKLKAQLPLFKARVAEEVASLLRAESSEYDLKYWQGYLYRAEAQINEYERGLK